MRSENKVVERIMRHYNNLIDQYIDNFKGAKYIRKNLKLKPDDYDYMARAALTSICAENTPISYYWNMDSPTRNVTVLSAELRKQYECRMITRAEYSKINTMLESLSMMDLTSAIIGKKFTQRIRRENRERKQAEKILAQIRSSKSVKNGTKKR